MLEDAGLQTRGPSGCWLAWRVSTTLRGCVCVPGAGGDNGPQDTDHPWLTYMSISRPQRGDQLDLSSSFHPPPSSLSGSSAYQDVPHTPSGAPNPTYAPFSPTALGSTTTSATLAAKRRSTILDPRSKPTV